ncbi:MAG: penicillin-binding transpeptidase domain-containing protein [Eubacteriales bacterium]|nr:penicillin-binding transpeptidase domain-containing protein [Eubacteriales bacterium]
MQRTPRNNDSMPVKGKSIIPTESEVRARAENKPEQPQKEVQPKAPKQRRSTFWAKLWVGVVTGIVLLFSVYLIYVLYKTTVTDYDKYARAAADEQWTLMTYSASRGMIYDSNLVPLASNTYDYTVICSPKMVTSTELTREQIIQSCVSMLGVTYEKMDSIIPVDPTDKNDKRNDVAGCDVIKNVPQDKKDEFEAYLKDNKVKGFGFVAVPQRYYNYGSLASQVIGYAKNDGVSLNGLYGLEAYYNDVLSGYDGYRYSETDEITGGVLPYSDATTIPVTDGNNIVTNIDISIQRIAEEAAKEAYDKFDPIDGVCAIVMNPYTGAIYAMVSLPNYDLNDPYAMPYGTDMDTWNFMSSEDRVQYVMANAWRNRCVSDTYEPGSTFKSLTTCMAFEENLTNENEMFDDAPIAISSQHTISCWMQKSMGYNHGMETLEDAFHNSCNPIFTQLAYRIGITKYYSYVRMLGFYDYTGIDLPAEGKGIFHKNPTAVDMAVLSYGESSTVTPIQLITSYCAIINGGDLLVPHIVKYVTDPEGNIIDEIEPEVVRTVFSEDTCKRVRVLMEGVVSDGTGSAGKVAGYSVAGKTSTSTIDVGELKGAHVLSFSCYAPSYDPKIAVLVVINKPRDFSVGSSSAASTAAKIVEGTLAYMGVERRFTEEEYDELLKEWYVQKVDGMPASQAASRISVNGLSTLYGTLDMTSDTIVARTYPDYYHTLYKTGVVVLYPEGVSQEQMLTTRVPNMIGMSAIECIEACLKMNLNCKINSDSDIEGICTAQSVTSGSTVYAGDIIYVTLTNNGTVSQPQPTPTPTPVPGGEDGVTDALPPEHHDEDDT